MPFELDRTMLPTREWVEGMDGGRNIISKVLLLTVGLGFCAFGIAMGFVVDDSATRWGAALAFTGTGATVALVGAIRPWRWPPPRPSVVATTGEVMGPALPGAERAGPGSSRGLLFVRRRGAVTGGRALVVPALVMCGGMVVLRSLGLRLADASTLRVLVELGLRLSGLAFLLWTAWLLVGLLRSRHRSVGFVVLPEGLGTAFDGHLEEFLPWTEVDDVHYEFWSPNSARGFRVLVASGRSGTVSAQLEAHDDHPSTLIYAARYYWEHPEDRAELADGRAVARLQDLLARGAPYADAILPD